MTTQEKLDDYALLAWGKFKAASGLPEESFTDRDRQMFVAGIAWFVADETTPDVHLTSARSGNLTNT